MRNRILSLVFAALALAGCASVELGAPIRIDQLSTLKPKVSDKSNVLLALGEPNGTGGMRFNQEVGQRGVWFYEHSTATSGSVKVTILLVFFDGDRYDGHYWFGEHVNLGKGK